MNKYFKFLPIILVLSFLSVGLIYCGGGGGGGGTAATGAFNLTEDNMVIAAEVAAADSGLYNDLSLVILQMMSGLSGAGPGGVSTAAVIDIGDIGLCALGSGTVSWNDADNNLDLSNGDSATLTLTDCQFESTDPDTIDGTLTLTFVDVSLLPAGFTADLDADVTIEEFFDSTSQTSTFTADFRIDVVTPDGDNYTVTVTSNDANDILVVTTDGQTDYRLGCFNTVVTFIISNPGTFTTLQNGVLDVPDQGIMAIASTPPPLSFVPGTFDPYPDSGSMTILSGGDCPGIGTVEGDGSYIILTAVPGDLDDVTLDLYDSADTLITTVNENWDNLN